MFVSTPGDGVIAWILSRSTDYDTPAEITPGTLVPVLSGTVGASTSWLETATVTTIGMTQFCSFAVYFL